MSDGIMTAMSLIGSTIITTVVSLIIKKTITNELNKTEELRLLRKIREQEEEKSFIENTIKEEIVPLKGCISEVDKKIDLISDGTLSSLRNDILTCYYRCREKGYRNDYDYQNIHDLYKAYGELHGNSFIADVMSRFDSLQTKEEVKDIDVNLYKKGAKSKKILNEHKKEEK